MGFVVVGGIEQALSLSRFSAGVTVNTVGMRESDVALFNSTSFNAKQNLEYSTKNRQIQCTVAP